MDPALEAGVTAVASNMIEGQLEDLKAGGDGLILGAELAASLGVVTRDSGILAATGTRAVRAPAFRHPKPGRRGASAEQAAAQLHPRPWLLVVRR